MTRAITSMLPLAAVAMLAACTPAPKAEVTSDAIGCGETKAAKLIGQVWTESMREPLLKRSGARALRVLGPDTMVTMDFRPDRLNVETDAQGRILRVKCG